MEGFKYEICGEWLETLFFFFYFVYFSLSQGFAIQPRLSLNSWFSFPSLQSAGTVVCINMSSQNTPYVLFSSFFFFRDSKSDHLFITPKDLFLTRLRSSQEEQPKSLGDLFVDTLHSLGQNLSTYCSFLLQSTSLFVWQGRWSRMTLNLENFGCGLLAFFKEFMTSSLEWLGSFQKSAGSLGS